jgi:hypothetical protein
MGQIIKIGGLSRWQITHTTYTVQRHLNFDPLRYVISMLFVTVVTANTVCLLHVLSCQRYVSALAPTQALGSCVRGGICPTRSHTYPVGTSDGPRRLNNYTRGMKNEPLWAPFPLF